MSNDNEDGSKAITYLKRAGYVAAAITAIAVLGFNVDGRYQKADAAKYEISKLTKVSDQTHYAQNLKREEGDIRTQINLIQLELQFMAAQQTADEARRQMLSAQLTVLLTRLAELQK